MQTDEPVASSSIHLKPHDPASDADLTVEQEMAAIEEDPDLLLEELEDDLDDDFDLGGFRERRMEEMRAQMQKTQAMKQSDYGKYTEVKIEKDVIAATAKAKRSVLHFFHRDFRRCKIMDDHLEKLAKKHFNTLFLKIEVSNAPFLVSKMEVQVLPCIVGFVAGVSKMKIVGFEALEGGDNFSTASLELTMIQCDVIDPNPNAVAAKLLAGLGAPASSSKQGSRRGIRGGRSDDDSDFDD